jgi:hypothetical protein
MNKHIKEQSEHAEDEKTINFNFGLVKGKMTFKQFIIMLIILCLGSTIVFSSVRISSSIFTYSKEPIEVKATGIEASKDKRNHNINNSETNNKK